ncbi:MAG TPA: hypothetical protein VD907_04160 [Verrucomicrobiae bacterium]|nr:hypothetical protein [Verrucomicrobiae bacterium]
MSRPSKNQLLFKPVGELAVVVSFGIAEYMARPQHVKDADAISNLEKVGAEIDMWLRSKKGELKHGEKPMTDPEIRKLCIEFISGELVDIKELPDL